MTWPGPAPRRGANAEPEHVGSAKNDDDDLHAGLLRACALVAKRAEKSHGATCGGSVVLSKTLGIRSFIAEFVVDKKRPVLLFVRHVVLRPIGNHTRRTNAWRAV